MGTPTLFMSFRIGTAPFYCIDNDHFFLTEEDTVCQCRRTIKLPKLSGKMSNLPQLSLDFLQNSFQVKPASKTFKTTPRDGISLEDCFKDANRWLRNQSEYTRVEFPYDNYYYVVAKLSETK